MNVLLEHLSQILGWFKEPAIALICLSILVFVHELGHFLVAKWCGVGVVKFAVGFGPAILKFRRNETDYQLGCIPLGGFVRMVGDMPDSLTGAQETDDAVLNDSEEVNAKLSEAMRDRSRWFIEKNLWQKSAIVFAGPLFNLLFSVGVVAATVYFLGRIDRSATLGIIRDNTPAQAAGLEVGDVVTAVDGKTVADWLEMAEIISTSKGKTITLTVERNGSTIERTATPQLAERMIPGGEKEEFYAIGISPALEYPDIFSSSYTGLTWTIDRTLMTYTGLWSILSGEISAKEGIAGPIKIYQVAKHQAKRGMKDYLLFMAFVSVSLAAINLLPVPILDGGHLLFFLFEGLFGPISIRKKEIAQQVGLLLILMLMVFAVHNDLTSDPLPEAPKDSVEWKKSEPTSSEKPTVDSAQTNEVQSELDENTSK